MKNARQAWDDEQIARAVGFTTSRFLGTGRFDTRPFATLDAAREDARGDRRAIVYAVTPEGFTIHIENGDRIGATEQTMTTTNQTFSSKSNAVRAARKDLGPDAIVGTDFHLVSKGDRWFYSTAPAETAEAAPVKETREEKRLRKIAEADAKNAAKAAKAKEPKAPRAPKAASAPKAGSKKAEAMAAAERGELPAAPDFSAETHKRFRKTLDALVVAANAGDLKTLKADKTEPKSSSRVTLCRYRDLCIVALEAQRKMPKAA